MTTARLVGAVFTDSDNDDRVGSHSVIFGTRLHKSNVKAFLLMTCFRVAGGRQAFLGRGQIFPDGIVQAGIWCGPLSSLATEKGGHGRCTRGTESGRHFRRRPRDPRGGQAVKNGWQKKDVKRVG